MTRDTQPSWSTDCPPKKRQLAFYFLAFLDKPFLSLKSNSQVEFVTGFILVCMIAEAQ